MNIDLIVVDPRKEVVSALRRAFNRFHHAHIHIIQASSLFNLHNRVDAYVLTTTSDGSIIDREASKHSFMKEAYTKACNALSIQSMLHNTVMPIGFAALLTPYLTPATKPHLIATPVAFTDAQYSLRTHNVFYALLAALRLVLEFNAHCKSAQERIHSVACPCLVPSMPARAQAKQMYHAFTTATQKRIIPGYFVRSCFYVPSQVACGAQERVHAHLEYEPFFEGYLAKKHHHIKPTHQIVQRTPPSRRDPGEQALGRWQALG